jgi:putative redox protein
MATALRTATTRQRDGLTHEIDIRGHIVVSDEPKTVGGSDLGPTPQELVAGALAACTAITLRMYGDRKGWNLDGLEVAVDSESGVRADCSPLQVTLRLPDGLDDDQIDRLRVIASKCPVHRMLATACEIENRVEFL